MFTINPLLRAPDDGRFGKETPRALAVGEVADTFVVPLLQTCKRPRARSSPARASTSR